MAPREKKAVRKVKIARANPSETVVDTSLVEEGHPAPSTAPSTTIKCHRMASLGPELERSEIHEIDLNRLRSMYVIPDDFRITILGPNNRVVSPPF